MGDRERGWIGFGFSVDVLGPLKVLGLRLGFQVSELPKLRSFQDSVEILLCLRAYS